MNFSEAFLLYPYDVERIAAETGIEPPEVDHLINKRMDEKHARRVKNARARADLSEIRARRPA